MSFSAEVLKNLTQTIDDACADPQSDIPGVSVVVVGKDGELFSHSAGKRGLHSSEPMTADTVFWIASCTKLITAIACMQLVEQGLLKMDDGDFVEKNLPYLKDVQVLQNDGTLAPKKSQITLRMLMTHTGEDEHPFLLPKYAYHVCSRLCVLVRQRGAAQILSSNRIR
jgi:CubicO group peptidase (beta-lactamase class C family)